MILTHKGKKYKRNLVCLTQSTSTQYITHSQLGIAETIVLNRASRNLASPREGGKMNCPNCGAIIKTSDKYCEYCGTQNNFSIEDVMKTRIFCDGYVAEQQTVYEDIAVYRDADGRLYKSVLKPKRIITIIEK